MSNPPVGPAMAGAVDLSGLVNKNRQPTPPPPGPEGSSGLVREVDDQSVGALVELSKTVPVILEIYGGDLSPQLAGLIASYGGRLVLGTVRAERAPELMKALQVEGYPVVAALVGGQPIPLFQGIPPEEEFRPVLDQVLELAQKNGVTGTLAPVDADEAEAPAPEPPLPPLHQQAYDALAANYIAGAKEAYDQAIKENPADSDAIAGMAHVELLERVQGLNLEQVRAAAAASPTDIAAALSVADLDFSGGHIADACQRLLGLYSSVEDDQKQLLRSRLLSFFVMAGPSNDDVKKARNALTSLMF
jgi:putative thioredoxin